VSAAPTTTTVEPSLTEQQLIARYLRLSDLATTDERMAIRLVVAHNALRPEGLSVD
jgi:hypothetical protein